VGFQEPALREAVFLAVVLFKVVANELSDFRVRALLAVSKGGTVHLHADIEKP
jgi:hypothetical protein